MRASLGPASTARRFGSQCLLLAVLLASGVQVAEAQWYKPWTWGGKRPQVQLPQLPMQGTLPAPQAVAPPPAVQPTFAPPPSAPARSPEELAAIELRREKARALDTACDSTVKCAQDRMDAWMMLKLESPGDAEAAVKYDRARIAFDDAKQRSAMEQQTQLIQEQDANVRIAEAQRLQASGDLDAAASILDELSRTRPSDFRAGNMRNQIENARRLSQLNWRRAGVALVVLIGLALLVWVGIVVWRRRQAAAAAAEAERKSQRAVLQVVDGVGRGRSFTIAGARARIGACEGEAEDVNDFVLSDADRQLSRFHCVVERRVDRFVIVDTSANGTELNGRRLRRGAAVRLRDGDELVLAQSARLRFTLV